MIMYNFLSCSPEMKNPQDLEEENDLTQLSLWFGSPKRENQSSTSTSTSTPTPTPTPTPTLTLTPSQTNSIPLIPYYPFSFLVPSINPIPYHNPNPLLEQSSLGYNINSNHNPSLESYSSNYNTNCSPNPLLEPSSSNYNANPQNNASTADENVPAPVPAPASRSTSRRTRRLPSKGLTQGQDKTVSAPFSWATNRRATVHSRQYLLQNNISTVTGKVQCKRCQKEFLMSLNVEEKVTELKRFIQRNKGNMHDRAPEAWSNPVLPKCVHCGRENSAKPVLGNKKREINWLFLFLTQTVSCCTLGQLKYFCKHTNNHRTGAKDRLVYLTYMGICKQLDPEWFN